MATVAALHSAGRELPARALANAPKVLYPIKMENRSSDVGRVRLFAPIKGMRKLAAPGLTRPTGLRTMNPHLVWGVPVSTDNGRASLPWRQDAEHRLAYRGSRPFAIDADAPERTFIGRFDQ